jgi:23S rRNA (guanosine2251-2'-O)-methyltransferase
LVAGTHAIFEVLKLSDQIGRDHSRDVLFVRQDARSESLSEIQDSARRLRIQIREVSEQFLERICFSHQGAVLATEPAPELDLPATLQRDRAQILLLDGIEDPHNLGAILRTAWLVGVVGVICPSDRSVDLSPTVHKVACGGVEHVPVLRVQSFRASIETLKEAGFWVFGLSHRAKQSLYQIKIPEKVVWVIGAEDKGMRSTTEALCDELISLPQTSPDASYNASVSAAVVMFEGRRVQEFSK